MARLRPTPFAFLARRLFRELSEKNAAFDLPARRFVRGEADLDLSAAIGGGPGARGPVRRAAVPFGPAAGPHTQLAQNIVLSWLAGGRAIELKTVQVNDALDLPRPCIDMREIGYNCEFSQELRVPESIDEYVKGALLVSMLVASGKTGVLPSFTQTVFDASVGYDLAGIRSPKVDGYLRALKATRPIVERLRAELPVDLRPLAEAGIDDVLADTVTLSTFHGCPPHEIEAIAEHLMTAHGLAVVVKLNPTLLGERDALALLHDALGYTDIVVPAEAFANDPTPEQAFAMIGRLRERAAALGLSFGVKLTNTLVVENRRGFFPASVQRSYLSGPPLHVLAMTLVGRFREALGMDLPMSFSAGIDAQNAADAIALDLVPVTVCTDWLKTGGYGRGIRLHEGLVARVRATETKTRAGFILRAFGHEEAALADAGIHGDLAASALAALRSGGDPQAALGEAAAIRWTQAAARRNTATYVARIAADPRYHRGHHEKAPKKVGSSLTTFDCLTCDKCVAVCPNDALFTYVAPHLDVPEETARKVEERFVVTRGGTVRIEERHQLASFADHCNDCGNCDAFCPEDGGPFREKPRFFGSLQALRDDPHGEGMFVAPQPGGYEAHVRSKGREVTVASDGVTVRYAGDGFDVSFEVRDPTGTLSGSAEGEVDLTLARVTHVIATSVLSPREVNPVTAMATAMAPAPEGAA